MTMNIDVWTCPNCGRNALKSVKVCRKCKKPKPVFGFVEETEKEKQPAKNNPKKKSQYSRDPLISSNEDELFVSTLKMKGEK